MIRLQACCFLSCIFLLTDVQCFMPNGASVLTSGVEGSQPHSTITYNAVMITVDRFLARNTDLYPTETHAKLKETSTFKEAMRMFEAFAGRPDLFPPMNEDPSYHFTAEKLIDSNARLITQKEKVSNAIKKKMFDEARSFASDLFHIAQDFYSETNWVELDKRGIKENLGTLEAFQDVYFAEPGEKTCDNCASSEGECKSNIKKNIITGNRLTSGYDSKHKIPKPPGKCSKGGILDGYRKQDAIGGINKDTNNPTYSPHHYLHTEAANLATDSTVDLLERIYQATIDKRVNFGEFLGIETAKTLCFVVDTTGSMGGEIAAVREMTISLTKEQKSAGMNYVLVPVNDPDPGIIHITDDPDKMIEHLNGLKADGGGDIPEMSLSGLLLAAENVRYGSTCYMYTDAEAKDKNLLETLNNVLKLRKIKVRFILTDPTRVKRSIRAKRDVVDFTYVLIAEASGGSVIQVAKKSIKEATKIIKIQSDMSIVHILIGEDVRKDNFKFLVDSTTKEVFIELSSINSDIKNLIFHSPSGETSSFETLSDVSNLKLIKLVNVTTGEWSINVELVQPTQSYSFRVFCETIIDFTYTFSAKDGAALDRKPIRGVNYTVSLRVYGAVKLESISLLFLSRDGSVISKIKVDYRSSFLITETVLPNEGFFVAIEGLDEQDKKFQRINPTLVRTTSVKLELLLGMNETLDMKPNSKTSVKIMLQNIGVTSDKWKLSVYDNLKYLTSPTDIDVTVPENKNETITLTFSAPATAKPGEVATVSLNVKLINDNAVANYLSFYISVVPEKSDLTLPSCRIAAIEKDVCDKILPNACNKTIWTAALEANDSESGLHIFRPNDRHAGSNFTTDKFSQGTTEIVTGKYISTCCFANTTIVAVDGNGNVGRCFLQVVQSTSFANSCQLSYFLILFLSILFANLA